MKNTYNFMCKQCEINHRASIMLNDDLWATISVKEEGLCLLCIEQRLNRRITMKDLSPAPINQTARIILERLEKLNPKTEETIDPFNTLVEK